MRRVGVPAAFLAVLAGCFGAGAGAFRRWRWAHEGAHGKVSPPAPVSTVAPAAPEKAAAATVTAAVAREPLGAAAPAMETVTFRGDRGRRHRAAFNGPAEPRLLFAFDVGGPVETMPAFTPAGDVVVASLSGRVVRLSPTGALVWTADLGDRIYASPLVTHDTVVIGSDARRVVALAVATGKPRWELDAGGEVDTAPAEAPNGTIVVAAGRVLLGLRIDGTVRFRLSFPRKVYGSAAIADDGTIYVGAQDHKLYAITPRGTVRWSRDLGADVDCAPALDGDGVFVGTDGGHVVALDAEGSERWRAHVGGFVRGGLTVARVGTVIAGTYGPAPRIVGLDPATGGERFTFRIQGTGAAEFGIHGGPLEDGSGNLYFGAQDDNVYAVDSRGHLRWTFPTHGDLDAPMALGKDGVLYVGSDDGHVYALH